MKQCGSRHRSTLIRCRLAPGTFYTVAMSYGSHVCRPSGGAEWVQMTLATRKRMALEDADAKMYGVCQCSRWCRPFIRTARSIVGKQATTGLGTSQLAGTEHNDVLPLLFATCPSLHEGTLPCQSIVRLRLSCNMAVAAHMKRSSTPRCFPLRMCTSRRLAHC